MTKWPFAFTAGCLLVFVGCSPAPQQRDVVVAVSSSTCLEVPGGKRVYLGGYTIGDLGEGIVIEKVSLVDANGLILHEARVLVVQGRDLPALATFTPDDNPAWGVGRSAEGLALMDEGQQLEIMIGVDRTLPIGTSPGLRVDYRSVIGKKSFYSYAPRYIGMVDKSRKCKMVDRRAGY